MRVSFVHGIIILSPKVTSYKPELRHFRFADLIFLRPKVPTCPEAVVSGRDNLTFLNRK